MPSRNCKGRVLHWSISNSRRVAELNDCWAKLLFTWIIPSTDNLGRMEGDPAVVAGMIFPRERHGSPGRVEGWLQELHEAGLICWYRADGDMFIHVHGHLKRNPLRGNMSDESDFPEPPSECPVCGDMTSHSNTSEPVRTRNPELKGSKGKGSKGKYGADTRQAIDFLNEKAGKNFQHVDSHLRLIQKRMDEGAGLPEIRAMIAIKVKEWRDDERMKKYLRPATLFAEENFWNYMGEVKGASADDVS